MRARGRERLSMSPKRSAWSGAVEHVTEEQRTDDMHVTILSRLVWWLKKDRLLPEEFRSAKKLHEAIEMHVARY
jgi:hypothetical protein